MNAPPAAVPPLPLRNCYWVFPGLLLAGEHPCGPSPLRTRQRLERLLGAGIECFVDLTHPSEMPRYDNDLPFNIDYLRNPIPDHGLPTTREQMVEILEGVLEYLSARRPVYVHCRAGIGRTGLVMGCLLVESGLTGDEAVRELNRLWQQCKRSKSWEFVPETDEQTSYIRKWQPQMDRQAASPGRAPPVRSAGKPLSGSSPTPQAAAGRARPDEPAQSPPNSEAAQPPSLGSASHPPSSGEPTQPPSFGRSSPSPSSNKPAQPRHSRKAARRVPATASPEADPLLEPETLNAARGLRERFVGTLIGLAVGDAVAAATQYRRPGSFTPVGDMLGGGPFDLPRGAWSDDTAMALCLADSLLERSGFDARDQVTRYALWQQEGYLSATGQCVGITASTARALAMSQWRRQLFAGSHDPKQLDPEPLSRVASAVLFFFSSPDEAIQQAADAARTTCQAPAVLDDCRTLARALHAAVSGAAKPVILDGVALAAGGATIGSTTASSALAAAFWAFASTDSFRDAVLRAANVGGNSDVVAAICGQLAGAHYGLAAIPAAWRNSLIHKDLIESYGDRLLAQCLLTLGT